MKKRIFFLSGFVISYFICEEMIAKGIGQVLKHLLTQKQYRSSLSDLIVQMATPMTLILFVYFFNKKTKEEPYRLKDFQKKDIYYGIASVIFCFIMNLLYQVMAVAFRIHSVSENQVAVNDILQHYPIYSLILVVLIAPIAEEFIFRKVIIGHMFAKKKMIGLLVSSVLFGLAHMFAGFDWYAMLSYITMGLIFGSLYLKTKRIETSVTAHAMNNLIMSLMLLTLIK